MVLILVPRDAPPRRLLLFLAVLLLLLIFAAYVAAALCPSCRCPGVATVQIATDLSFATAARLAILAQAVLHGHVEKTISAKIS
ncbi:hypothetical protein [Paraburkholderia strydomiana]|jgi:hypothetical protein|uniref:hypothetical protein n=1 Tax=Paraburkholderia strydomiana TaxID=1245417 RepID=UPI0038B71F4F